VAAVKWKKKKFIMMKTKTTLIMLQLIPFIIVKLWIRKEKVSRVKLLRKQLSEELEIPDLKY